MSDWRTRGRFAARLVGAGALAAGLAFAGYGINQLWVTGIEAAQAQDDLEATFEARLAAAEAPDFGAPVSPIIDLAAADDTLEGFDDPDDIPVMVPAAAEELDAPPTAEDLEVFGEPAPEAGGPVGRIVIEGIDVDWIIIEGVTAGYLRQGPGHMPGTPLPGQPGNSVLSGHRTTNGAPFHNLDQLEVGDAIEVQTLIGTHRYEVMESLIVNPTELWVMRQVPGSWLTLTTCHPKLSSRQRMIVFAQLVDGPNEPAIAAAFSDVEVGVPQP